MRAEPRPQPELTLIRRAEGTVDDDAELIQLAETDRERAYDVVFRRHRDELFRHAAMMLRDWEEAIDVTQEVFIRAMRETRFFDADFRRRAWLFRVTSNMCINMTRDRRRHRELLSMVPSGDDATDAVELVFQTRRQEKVLEAIDRMTDDHREILMLRYYSDLSFAEIGDTLQVKLGTVMSRIARARARLMEVLDELGVEQP